MLPAKAILVMVLKVPLQKRTVRGPTHRREKERSRTDWTATGGDIVIVEWDRWMERKSASKHCEFFQKNVFVNFSKFDLTFIIAFSKN